MRSLLVSSVVTTLAVAWKDKVACDAFHVHVVRSTSLSFAHRTSGVTMKDSLSTAESLEGLRKVQKANGGVVGDARYEDGEML